MVKTFRLGTGVQLGIAAAIAALPIGPASAQPAAEFYKGKTVTIVVGQEPGTGFDIYSRTLARHFGRLIPGNPTIVVQNMPGASGVVSGNWLNNIAPKDGTVIGTFSQNVALEPLFGNAAAKYDATKMLWIGNMEQSASVCGATADAGIKSFEDLQKKEFVFGATGPTGPLGQAARALNMIADTKLKIIYGYKGSASIKLAMAKGEVQGICGLPWSTVNSFWKDLLDAGNFKPVIQLSAAPSKAINALAHIDQFAKTPETRQLIDLIFGQLVLGRIYAMPPGVPSDRVEAIRASFMATLADKEFLADAEKTRIDIIPATGPEVEKLIKSFYASSPEIVARAKQTVDPQTK